jgi:hypothetical protein
VVVGIARPRGIKKADGTFGHDVKKERGEDEKSFEARLTEEETSASVFWREKIGTTCLMRRREEKTTEDTEDWKSEWERFFSHKRTRQNKMP